MKAEIGVMVNGAFIKRGSIVMMFTKRYDSFYAIVTEVEDKEISFMRKCDDCVRFEFWENVNFIELVQ